MRILSPKLKTLTLSLSFCAATIFSFVLMAPTAWAAYHADHLIDNFPFIDSTAMSEPQIQNFLNDKNSGLKGRSYQEVCDNSYMTSHYAHCGQTVSVAWIIRDAGVAYGLNPRTIMATMQKEQSLITDPSPSTSQRNCAMGYQSCANDFQGFFTQVDWGTYQLRRNYETSQGHTYIGSTAYACNAATDLYSAPLVAGNRVRFADPGGKAVTITIANPATASLYCYTPYVGPFSQTGYSGSYNFVASWESWWGSTLAGAIRLTYIDRHSREGGGTATVEYSLVDQPTANVTIPLSLPDTTESSFSGSSIVSSSSLTITPSNWNHPENNKVIVYGVDDPGQDGTVAYQLIAGQPTSSDDTYGSLTSADAPNAVLYNDDDEMFTYGLPSDTPLAGDWNCDGKSDIGFKRGNTYVLSVDRGKTNYAVFTYGPSDATPLVGHWTGNSARCDTISLKINNKYYINNGLDNHTEKVFSYGAGSAIPLVGNWDGDGSHTDTISLKVGNKYFINNQLDGASDSRFYYGSGSETPIVGDWDGNLTDTIGLKAGNKYFINNGLDGTSDHRYYFGTGSETPVTGDWDGNVTSTVGVKRGNTYLLNVVP